PQAEWGVTRGRRALPNDLLQRRNHGNLYRALSTSAAATCLRRVACRRGVGQDWRGGGFQRRSYRSLGKERKIFACRTGFASDRAGKTVEHPRALRGRRDQRKLGRGGN